MIEARFVSPGPDTWCAAGWCAGSAGGRGESRYRWRAGAPRSAASGRRPPSGPGRRRLPGLTSASRVPAAAPPMPPRPPCLSASFIETRDACQAGTMLKPTPVSTESSNAKPRTRASTAGAALAGSAVGTSVARTFIPAGASSTPSSPPASAISAPSAIICVTRRARLAPSAERTAISRRRPRPRASSSPARLAQAISRTHPAAPIRTRSSMRVLPTVSSRMGTTAAPILRSSSGYSAASWPRDGAHVLARLGERDARLEPRHHVEVVRAAVDQVRGREVNRDPEIHLAVAEGEIARHDADDGVLQAVDQDVAVDHARVAGIAALPERIADDGDGRAGAVFVFGEGAAGDRLARRGRRRSSPSRRVPPPVRGGRRRSGSPRRPAWRPCR